MRWKQYIDEGCEHWIGVFSEKVWILKQEDEQILYKVFTNSLQPQPENNEEDFNKVLHDYFQLDLKIEQHYQQWSESDQYFKDAARQFYGIRILKQDVVENIFSFICSSMNNISRISSMVEKLAKFYGNKICEINGEEYYSFPNINALANKGVETKLRDNGFGYRAKYISNSAEFIVLNGGTEWLQKLDKMKYEDAKKTLMQLTGIGAKLSYLKFPQTKLAIHPCIQCASNVWTKKYEIWCVNNGHICAYCDVADCICLMSLGHLQAIPVDTHIYQIAARLYMPKLPKQKTVTEKIYNEIGDHFRKLYGPLAGWAHTVLFCADLKKFQGNNEDAQNSPKSKKKKVKKNQ